MVFLIAEFRELLVEGLDGGFLLAEQLLDEFLPGEDPGGLTNSTPLMTTGILDSIAVLKVVTFLEEKFGIRIEPHEAVVVLGDAALNAQLKRFPTC